MLTLQASFGMNLENSEYNMLRDILASNIFEEQLCGYELISLDGN